VKINNLTLGIIVLVLIFGGIGITMAFNQWQTEGTKEPAKYTSGEFTGVANPADIRGSYSFGDISAAWDISADTLGAAFGLEEGADAAAFQCKELETIYASMTGKTKIGTDSVRVFVALYTGLPYALAETTYLPRTAVDILLAEGALDEAQLEYLASHAVDTKALAPAVPVTDNATAIEPGTPKDGTHTETVEGGVVKGKTTFQNLLDWGLSQAQIEDVISGAMPPGGTIVRDYAVAQGLEFASVKTELQALLDELK
jgi:hypothetical protein